MTNTVMKVGRPSTNPFGPTTNQWKSIPIRTKPPVVDRLGNPLLVTSTEDPGRDLDWFSLSRIEEDLRDPDVEMIHLCMCRDNQKDLPESDDPWM